MKARYSGSSVLVAVLGKGAKYHQLAQPKKRRWSEQQKKGVIDKREECIME